MKPAGSGAVEAADGGGDFGDLVAAEVGVEGQRKDFLAGALGDGQGAAFLPASSECGLKVKGDGIVDAGPDAVGGEVSLQFVAALGADDVEVVDAVRGAFDGACSVATLEELVVEGSEFGAAGVPLVDFGEEGEEVAALELVEAGVDSGPEGDHAAAASAVAHFEEFLCAAGEGGGDGAAIAEGAEVLGGIEAIGDVGAPGGQGAVLEASSVGLGGILDEEGSFAASPFGERVDGAGLAVEMDGDEGAGGTRPMAFDALRVELEGFRIDVGELDLGSGGEDADSGKGGGQGSCEDLVMWGGDSLGAEADFDGGGAVADAGDVGGAGPGGEAFFEGGQLRA